MICQFCSKDIPDGSRFCGFCGNAVPPPTAVEVTPPVNLPVASTPEVIAAPPAPAVQATPAPASVQVPVKVVEPVSAAEPAPIAETVLVTEPPVTETAPAAETVPVAEPAPIDEPAPAPAVDTLAPPTVPVPETPPDVSSFFKSESDPKVTKPVGAWGYFWTDVVLLIPILNIIMFFVWAFSSNTKKARQSYVRSRFIWFVVCLVLSIVGALLLLYVFPSVLDYWVNQWQIYF